MHSPDHSSKGTPSGLRAQLVSWLPRALRLLVGRGVQGLFHSPCGVLFTFPSRYSCTIGGPRVFSLGGWSPQLPTGFLVSRGTQEHSDRTRQASATGLSPPRARLPSRFACPRRLGGRTLCPTTPPAPRCRGPDGLGSSRLARHYYGNLSGHHLNSSAPPLDVSSSRY
jgi:hypothetical protein